MVHTCSSKIANTVTYVAILVVLTIVRQSRRDPGIGNSTIPNPGFENSSPGLQSLVALGRHINHNTHRARITYSDEMMRLVICDLCLVSGVSGCRLSDRCHVSTLVTHKHVSWLRFQRIVIIIIIIMSCIKHSTLADSTHISQLLSQGSQQGKINFRTKFFSKYQDNFRTFCRFHKVQNTEDPATLD